MNSSAFSERIVQSLLDTDFYKLTMMQAVLHHYPNAEVEWAFRSRSDEDLAPYLDRETLAAPPPPLPREIRAAGLRRCG